MQDQNLMKSILDQCKQAAQRMAANEAQAFVADAKGFLQHTENDLAKWQTQYVNGEIDADDLKWVLGEKKDVADMQALKRKGIAKIRLDELQQEMLDIVVSTISKAV